MTIYSSGKHEKLTADPQPWKNLSAHGGRWPHESRDPLNDALRPRPEFDRPLNNPANPVLRDVRFHATNRRGGEVIAGVYREWLHYARPGSHPDNWSEDITADQVEHARRVLERLAAINEVAA